MQYPKDQFILETLYELLTNTVPENTSLNASIIEAYQSVFDEVDIYELEDYVYQHQNMFKRAIPEKLTFDYYREARPIYTSELIFFVYYLVDNYSATAKYDWPFLRERLVPVFMDLGISTGDW